MLFISNITVIIIFSSWLYNEIQIMVIGMKFWLDPLNDILAKSSLDYQPKIVKTFDAWKDEKEKMSHSYIWLWILSFPLMGRTCMKTL